MSITKTNTKTRFYLFSQTKKTKENEHGKKHLFLYIKTEKWITNFFFLSSQGFHRIALEVLVKCLPLDRALSACLQFYAKLTSSSFIFCVHVWELHCLTCGKKICFPKMSNVSYKFSFSKCKHTNYGQGKWDHVHYVQRGLTRARSRTLSPDFSCPPLVMVVSYSVYP